MSQEKPILFSGEMVRAILDGRKTQTRRVVKSPFPKHHSHPVNLKDHGCAFGDKEYSGKFNDPWSWGYPFAEDGSDMPLAAWLELNPYGKVGDRLWVRETFCIPKDYDTGNDCSVVYRASCKGKAFDGCWKPSIFMPRWLSRITLEITDIRVERLQDISEEDALAEGVEFVEFDRNEYEDLASYKYWFLKLWDKINGKASTDSNPWVWVIEFKVIKP